MKNTPAEHETEALRQLNELGKERVGLTPRERIAVAQVHATMAMASALSTLATAVSDVAKLA
ncbi:MAG: hypothetical protein IIC53_07900 [Proteobacteria bacterium]|nr:hypothetical protein [Pseudomonadota bacterium]